MPVAALRIVRHVEASRNHNFRFDVVTNEEEFVFSADSNQDKTEWMMLLGAALQRRGEGGAMANPARSVR